MLHLGNCIAIRFRGRGLALSHLGDWGRTETPSWSFDAMADAASCLRRLRVGLWASLLL